MTVMIPNPADGSRAERVSTGSARRRRERRLRSMLRHERMSVAMALAEKLHHSAQRPEMARAGERARVEVHGRVPEDAPQAAGAVYFEMDTGEDDGSAPAAARPAPLMEVLPQVGLERHDGIAYELVIAVPKILPHDVPPRRFCRVTQLAEQLVEVPTPVSYSWFLQRIMEQHVDIPVPVGRGRNDSLQGFLPEQSSIFSFSSSERISERIMEQIVDIPVARGDPELGEGVFRTFPRVKKSPKFAASPSPRVPASGSSWTRAAYGQGTVADDDECFFEDDAGNVWTKTSKHTWLDPLGQSWLHVRRPGAFYWWNLDTQHTQWLPPWDS